MNQPGNGKNVSWLMKNISKVRTGIIIILAAITAYLILNDIFYRENNGTEKIFFISGCILIVLFLIFLIILVILGNRNYEDSSEELSEYKRKNTNTFLKK